MSNNKYCAVILGQGGTATSLGMVHLASLIRDRGIACGVFPYEQWQAVEVVLRQRYGVGDKLAVVTYSLGGSTGTYLGTRDHIDLLMCVFESSFAQNYPVDHSNVAHSVLFHGPGELSDAGLSDNFDEIVEVPNSLAGIPVIGGLVAHLEGQFSSIITDGVLTRLAKL